MQYNPAFVSYRPILTDSDKRLLQNLALQFSLYQFKNDNARNYEETMVDFVYTSAKIEGNTYDRIDTDNLLRLGVTAGSKRYSDAVMLVNLRDGFEKVMATEVGTNLDLDYFCDLHQILMKNLLPAQEQGIVRTSAVTIGASTYEPLSDPVRLRSEIRFVFQEANKYTDPFEKAIYLHCNLAYLQYFRDGNKRTARMMQTAALVQGNRLPLFFSDTLIDKYQHATVRYYETGDYAHYVAFFKENYEFAISRRLGRYSPVLSQQESQVFDHRVSALPELENATGAAYIFGQLAQAAITASGSAKRVNWPDVERQAMVESIQAGQSPEAMGSAICQYSPGACSVERQQFILDDLKRLAVSFRAARTLTPRKTSSTEDWGVN